jgi:hypothetical protein
MMAEVRVRNEVTGGEKGSKEERFDLIPPEPVRMLARVFGKGAAKYAEYNWAKGYNWGLSYAALQRHLHAFWSGEYLDPETGLPHLAHACWHTMVLQEFHDHHKALDDRWQWPVL